MHNVFAFVFIIASATGTPDFAELTAKSNQMSMKDLHML